MDININLNVNSQPLVEMAGQLNEANSNAQNLNNTLSNRAPENQINSNGSALKSTGRAMTGLKAAVSGFDKLVGTEIGGAVENVGSLGSGLIGLSRVVPVASGAFQAFGAALKANPIFLIASIIAGVVLAIGALLQSMGLLQPLLDSIGNLLKPLVDGFKALFGITGDVKDATEEAKEAIDALGDSMAKLDRDREKLQRRYSEEERLIQKEIALLKARGASAEEIAKKEMELLDTRINNSSTQIAEEKKNLLILLGLNENYMSSSDIQFQQLIRQQVDLKTSAILNEKEKNKAREELTTKYEAQFNKILDARVARDEAVTNKEIARLEREREARERAISEGQKAQEKANKAKEKLSKEEEKAEKDREKLRKDTTAAIIQSINEEAKAISEKNNKELDILKQKLLEGKITEETFAAEKVLLEKKTNDEIIKLRDNFSLTEVQQFIVGAENEKAIRQKNADEVLRLQRSNIDIELGIIKKGNQEKIQQTAQDEKDRVETFEREWLQKKIDLLAVEGLSEKELAMATKQLEIDKNKAKLDALVFGSSEYLALKEKIAEQERDIDKKTKEEAIKNQKEITDASFELANAGLTSLQTMSDIFFQNKLKAAKGNAAEEEKIARQQFKVNKAFQIGQAVMNGLQSVLAITSTAVDPTGVTTALRVAAQVALNVATIAKIAATQFTGAGSSAGGSQGASTPAISVPTTPSFNLFGQGNQMNVSAAQPTTSVSDPQGNILRVIAEVSETEISAVQARNRRYSNSAEL